MAGQLPAPNKRDQPNHRRTRGRAAKCHNLVTRGQVRYGALSELPDHDHPRACPSVLLA